MPAFSDIADMDLDQIVRDIIRCNTSLGANAVCARLKGIGVKVQRQRVRDSVLRVDPEGVAQRSMRPQLNRRTYMVAGPNSLWHIDGNHKLIR